jgi:bacillithiol system protein YtxJ
MNWIQLKEEGQLNTIKELSDEQTVLIFKHSTRCSISSMALDRLERSWKEEEMANVKPYFLDLLQFKPISNKIASQFGIEHESPQILLIKKGICVYHESHGGISYQAISKNLLPKS